MLAEKTEKGKIYIHITNSISNEMIVLLYKIENIEKIKFHF